MDKFKTLITSLETELKINTEPTQEYIAQCADINIRELKAAKEKVLMQIEQNFNEIIKFVKFQRASIESLYKLSDHIDSEIANLSDILSKQPPRQITNDDKAKGVPSRSSDALLQKKDK